MRDSPNGKKTAPYFNILPRYAAAVAVAALKWLLPLDGEDGLAQLVRNFTGHPLSQARITAEKYLSYHSMLATFSMSNDSMRRVGDFNTKALDRLQNRLRVYYAAGDGWIPPHYREDFMRRWPDVPCVVDEHIIHAFALRRPSADRVAAQLAIWIE
ncbi:hypothetical protein HDU93_002654 [Gonapodya sp. JEL0774]|nr:hypothetical protein HDU93_002654 [Gonapodya sp. JEL0774]